MKCLSGNRLYPTLRVLVLFWAQFTPETTSLFLSNDTNPRSKINHRILVELIKKTPFFAKNGLFKIKNRLVNKDQEVKDQFNSTYLEPRNSGLTVGVQLFVVTRLKLALFQF